MAYLQQQLKSASSYEEWKDCAAQIDRLEGKDEWKENPISREYDYQLVKSKIDQLKKARESGDKASISYILRTSNCFWCV